MSNDNDDKNDKTKSCDENNKHDDSENDNEDKVTPAPLPFMTEFVVNVCCLKKGRRPDDEMTTSSQAICFDRPLSNLIIVAPDFYNDYVGLI